MRNAALLILAGAGLMMLSRQASASNAPAAWYQPGGLDWTDYLYVDSYSGLPVKPDGQGGYVEPTTGQPVPAEEVAAQPTPDTSPEATGEPPATTYDDAEIQVPAALDFGTDFQTVGFDMNNTNVQAFLRMIRHGESGQGDDAYRMIVFGGYFDDFTDHPKIFKIVPGTTKKTSAAGAYQITWTTWQDLKQRLRLPDFSPASQDIAAVELIRRRGALDDVKAGRFESAITKVRQEWTSVPGGPEQRYSMNTAKQVLAQWGADFGPATVYA